MSAHQTPLSYWRGSAVSKGQSQEIEVYNQSAINVFKLKGVPDFASGRFKSMEHLDPGGRVSFIVSLQKSLLKSLAYFSYSQMSETNNIACGYSLRIIYRPSGNGSKISTEIYLLARVSSNNGEITNLRTKQAHYIESSLRSQLYQFEPDRQTAEVIDKARSQIHQPATKKEFDWQTDWLNSGVPLSCYEILKQEDVFPWLEEEKKYFYSPGSYQVNNGNNMIALFEQLQSYTKPVCIDITLVPTQVENYEKKVISRYLEALNKASRGDRQEEIEPDSNTQNAKTAYENVKKKYYSGIVFLYSYRVFSPCHNTAYSVANQLATTCTANAVTARVIEITDINYAIKTALQININEKTCLPGIWDNTAPKPDGFQGGPDTLKRLHRLVDLDEATAFFRLPIAINQPCAGVEYDTGINRYAGKQQTAKTINLGNYSRNGITTDETCEFNIEDLKTHLLIVGGSGSGKTTTTFNLLTQLWGKHKIPFMIFDPKVTPEYRYLKRLDVFKDDLLIFTPGQELVTPFRFNPFDVIDGIPLQEHISRIFDCFMGALNLEDPLPSFIQEAIDFHYERRKWKLAFSRGGATNEQGEPLETPTMPDIFDKILDLAQKNYGSDKEVGDRIKGALKARLYRLVSKTGVGLMLEASRVLPLDRLMEKPIVFELGGLNQEEQSLFSLFMLVFVFEYVRTVRVGKSFQPKTREDGSKEKATDLDLRHVILVEEAHNMLGKISGTSEVNGGKSQVIDKFAQIMREMRATGEGVIVVDQSPSALAQPIVDATNLKLMHRLPSPDDREYLGRAMCLTEGEAQLSGIFSPGECFYYVPGWDAARRVATENFKAKPEIGNHLETPCTDDEVKASMQDFIQRDTTDLISEYEKTKNRLAEDIAKLEARIDNGQLKREIVQLQLEQKKNQIKKIAEQIQLLSERGY